MVWLLVAVVVLLALIHFDLSVISRNQVDQMETAWEVGKRLHQRLRRRPPED